jgi:hypothetical protein
MANRYTIGSGLASNPATWDGGVSVPVSGDRVLISAGTTVTLDGTYEWGDDSTATISVNGVSTTRSITILGKLSHSRSVNSSLTCLGWLGVLSGGEHDIGTVASPIPQGVTATIFVNKSNTSPANQKYSYEVLTGGKFTYVGVFRKRHTTLTALANSGATTIFVAEATGWQIGDLLHITCADTGAPQNVTIAAGYTPGSLTVPLSAALVTTRVANIAVGNVTSNVTITSFSTTLRGGWASTTSATEVINTREIRNTAMLDLEGNFSVGGGATFRTVNNFGDVRYPNPYTSLDSIVFGSSAGITAMSTEQGTNTPYATSLVFSNCLIVKHSAGGTADASVGNLTTISDTLFANATANFFGNYQSLITNCKFAHGNNSSGIISGRNAHAGSLVGCSFSGFAYGMHYSSANVSRIDFTGCDIGVALPLAGPAGQFIFQISPALNQSTLTDCLFDARQMISGGTTGQDNLDVNGFVRVANKNLVLTAQEEYRYNYTAVRNNATVNRSASTIQITPAIASNSCTRTLSIPCANGASIRVVGYVRRITGTTTATVSITGTIAGVSITPQTFTAGASSIGAWERYVLVATNTTGNDGNLTLTYTANASSLTTPDVYFDGVPDSPFVTRARHFGFLYDEASPTRTVNQTVTLTNYTPTAASLGTDETTAIGITGITAGASVSLTSSRTFQQVYDYTQAWSAANLASAVPITGVGIAGSPSLFANVPITTTGFTLNGSGSLSMGAFLLTGNQPWAYTYTGGTFSQASTVPSFSGGTLTLSTASAKTFNMTGGQITFSVAGTSDLSTSTLAGNVNLVNTSGGTVNITLAGGQSYTNTGPNINVTAATINQGLSFTGLSNGSEVFIFNTGTQTVIASTTSVTGNAFLWQQVWAADKTVDYTILKDGLVPIRVVGVLVGQAVQAVPVSQVTDRSYITPTGLTFGSTATVNTGTSRFTVTVATSVQNWYSFMVQNWRTQATLKNVAFPLSSNGPNSFSLEGWEFSSGINFLRQDGLRYTASGVVTMIYAALSSVDTAAGLQIRYQQTDGGTTTAAQNTGPINQLIQVFGDAGHGNFDRRGFLALKVQADGFDQAETDVVATYGNLEDQLYIVGLNPLSNGLATGAPTVNGSPTITDHGASPVTWNSKQFSITITDSAAGNSGTTLMRWIRYNLSLGGTFQGKAAFNWHDLVQTNGSSFKSVRGAIYGDSGLALKGVRVLTNAGAPHPDFNLHTADDGTTFAPVFPASATATVLADTRVQLYNVTTSTELDNQFVTGTTYSFVVSTGVTVGDTLRLRACKLGRQPAEAVGLWAATGITFLANQPEDTIYTTWGIDGSNIPEFSGDVTGHIYIDANDLDGATTKTRLGAWYSWVLTTGIGITNFYGGVTYLSASEIRINVDVANILIENVNPTTALRFTDTEVRLFRSDGSSIIAPSSYSIHNDYSGVPDFSVVTVGGVNVITGDIADIPAAPSAVAVATAVLSAATTTPIAANIEKIKNITVNGDGTPGSPWGP